MRTRWRNTFLNDGWDQLTDGSDQLTREGGHGVPIERHKMAREVIDMTTSKNAAEVDGLVSTYMTDEGFCRTAYGQQAMTLCSVTVK
jgi:hypothetical protein